MSAANNPFALNTIISNAALCCVPALLCCNEPDLHRRDWLAKTLESFLPHSLKSRVIVSAQDGRSFGQSEAGLYDKVGKEILSCLWQRVILSCKMG